MNLLAELKRRNVFKVGAAYTSYSNVGLGLIATKLVRHYAMSATNSTTDHIL